MRIGPVDSGDYIDMTHSAGTSDGLGRVTVIDPGVVTGQDYEITFEEDTVTGSPTKGSLLWNVTNKTSGAKVLSGYKQGATFADPGYPAADGLTWAVTGPPDAFKNFIVTANADGSCTEAAPCQGSQDWGGFPTAYTGRKNQSDGKGWFFHGGGAGGNSYSAMISRIIRGSGWKYLIPNDIEYRWTWEDDNYAYAAYTTGTLVRVGFEIWNVTQGFRYCPWFYDYDGNEAWGLHANDHPGSGGSNDPYTDWTYPRLPEDTSEGEAGYTAWLKASIEAGGGTYDAANLLPKYDNKIQTFVEPYLPNYKIGIMHLAAGIWKDDKDMRLDKSVKIDIKTLDNKSVTKSLRFGH